jgi:hypothetical protein
MPAIGCGSQAWEGIGSNNAKINTNNNNNNNNNKSSAS